MYKILAILILSLLFSCSQQHSDPVTIQNAWIREAPPNASAMAGYLSITNTSQQDRILTFAKSKQFNAVEFHRTIVKDGIAKMRRHKELSLPAGKTLEFKPGDFHLMLMSPKSKFQSGDEVTVTLCILNNDEIKEIDVIMPIKKP